MSDPAARAAALGHDVKPDPPHEMSRAERWTCTRCGGAVIRYNGNVYGAAVDYTCAKLTDLADAMRKAAKK